ncbi:Uncharacterised protein [Akkermansia muciniphila]|uniref:Uncharacterized protein n=1 Tax=Akkermansia muciniphila TaxID=239935 RepID=A0A6N2SWY0_9BACT
MEVGEVFVDVGGVDAHEGGAVADPAHLVAQGVLLGRAQRVDRAARYGGHHPLRFRGVGRRQGAHGVIHLLEDGVCGQVPGQVPEKFRTGLGVDRIRNTGILVVLGSRSHQNEVAVFHHQVRIIFKLLESGGGGIQQDSQPVASAQVNGAVRMHERVAAVRAQRQFIPAGGAEGDFRSLADADVSGHADDGARVVRVEGEVRAGTFTQRHAAEGKGRIGSRVFHRAAHLDIEASGVVDRPVAARGGDDVVKGLSRIAGDVELPAAFQRAAEDGTAARIAGIDGQSAAIALQGSLAADSGNGVAGG